MLHILTRTLSGNAPDSLTTDVAAGWPERDAAGGLRLGLAMCPVGESSLKTVSLVLDPVNAHP